MLYNKLEYITRKLLYKRTPRDNFKESFYKILTRKLPPERSVSLEESKTLTSKLGKHTGENQIPLKNKAKVLNKKFINSHGYQSMAIMRINHILTEQDLSEKS